MRASLAALFAVVLFAQSLIMSPLGAQTRDVVWVQIEAQPSLRAAQDRARVYATQLPDVNGFSLGGGWYGIAIGPYSRDDADKVRRAYRGLGQIPRDSYIAFSSTYRQQFWPIGSDVLGRGAISPPAGLIPDTVPVQAEPEPAAPPQEVAAPEPVPATTPAVAPATPAPLPEPQPEPEPDETAAQARRSEARLNGQEKRQLQIALKSAGFYTAAIDGAFGRGTRRSMAGWQTDNGFDDTGVLTTRQRQVLLDQYNAPLISVGMREVTDARAGVSISMPTAGVRFARYSSPFAHYNTAGTLGVRVLLISQPGDRATLGGLYDIMQTLEIVPLDGPRELNRSGFTLEGKNSKVHSYTEATLRDGAVKGFSLIWPVGDEARRARVLEEMKASFRTLPAVLSPRAGEEAVQDIDLVSGLRLRRPRITRSGVFVDASGAVLTTAEAVQNCGRVTLDHDHPARVAGNAGALAVLRPETKLVPISVALLSDGPARLRDEVAVAGYSYGGTLGAPSLTFGTLAAQGDLDGAGGVNRLALRTLPGDAGGPLFDNRGGVTGVLLAREDGARQLPEDVAFAADLGSITDALQQIGIRAGRKTGDAATLAPQDLSRLARDMTVLVSCWD